MPKQQPAEIRLAPADQPGANLYNSYHCLTQLAGLYGQAAACEPDAQVKAGWDELSDSTLNDLGDLYLAWEVISKTPKPEATPIADLALNRIVTTLCWRIHVFTKQLNTWTAMTRWARATALVEQRWQRLLAPLAASHPELGDKLAEFAEASLSRLARSTKVADAYLKQDVATNACFAVAAKLKAK